MVRSALISITVLTFLAFVPVLAGAQEGDLRAALYASLSDDPSTASLSPAELEALVDALAVEAEAQGIVASDFAALSDEDVSALVAAADTEEEGACTYPRFICAANEAFGFDGNNITFPIVLGAASGALAIIIALVFMRRHHHEQIIRGGGMPVN